MTSTTNHDAFAISTIFANAWKLFRAKFWVLFWLSVLPNLVVLVGDLLRPTGVFSGSVALIGLAIEVVGYLLMIWGFVASLYVVVHDTKSLNIETAFQQSLPYVLGSIAVMALTVLSIAAGFVFLIVPGILLSISLSFASYIYIAEKTGIVEALTRSYEYVSGRWWAVAGRSLVLSLLGLGILIAIMIPAMIVLFAGEGVWGEPAAIALFTVIIMSGITVLAMYALAFSASVYKGIRSVAKA